MEVLEENYELEDLLEEANADLETSENNTESEEIEAVETTNIPSDTEIRFSGAPWYQEIKQWSCIIGGCGGIGSHLAFQLSRMHPYYITIYDPDTVEAVNLAGQLFSINDIGQYKVNATYNMCIKYATFRNLRLYNRKLSIGDYIPAFTDKIFLFSCFDNMIARKEMFNIWKSETKKHPDRELILIDGRLSFDTLQVFYVDKSTCAKYESDYLFSDKEADATVCSMKQTTYMAAMIAAFMVNIVTTYLTNKTIQEEELKINIPLLTEYDSSLMYLKTEE